MSYPRGSCELMVSEITIQLLERLALRLPAVLADTGEQGKKVIIHIAPRGRRLWIEWPPDFEAVLPVNGHD